MKLKRGFSALIGLCQYVCYAETSQTSNNNLKSEFLSKFETGNFPDFPKVTLEMFSIVDRYTALVYDNQKHQANAYKSELLELKSGLLGRFSEFESKMEEKQGTVDLEVKKMKETIVSQAEVIEKQTDEIQNLKDEAIKNASSNENILSKLQNQGKIFLKTVSNFKKVTRTDRANFDIELAKRDAIIVEQTKTIEDFKKSSVSMNKEVNEHAESIEELQEDVEENTLLVTNVKAENSEQNKEISDLKLSSASLNKEVNEHAESIEELQEDVEGNTLLVTNLKAEDFKQTKAISDLKLSSASLNKEVDEQAESIDELQEDVEGNTLLVTNLKAENSKQSKVILENSDNITDLKAENLEQNEILEDLGPVVPIVDKLEKLHTELCSNKYFEA